MNISINLTIHNKGFLIGDVLESIRLNTSANYELIIVLDGCTDDSEAIVDNFFKKNSNIKFKKIYADNVFEVKANNIAAKNSSGEFIIIIQDDMVIRERDWDRRIIKPMLHFEDIFAVTSRTAHNWIINPHSQDINLDFLPKNKWSDILIHVDHADRSSISRDTFAIRNSVNRGPLAIKHDILNKMGYFDEAYYPQDMDEHDLCYRAKKHGYKCGCYWIDYISDLHWGGTRENGQTKQWLLEANFKNSKIFLERYKDLLKEENRLIENRTI